MSLDHKYVKLALNFKNVGDPGLILSVVNSVTDFVDSHLQKDDAAPGRCLVHAYMLNDRYDEARQLIQVR